VRVLSTKIQSQEITPSFFDKREDTVLTWLGMAGVLINARGTILFIDPLITVARSDGQQICESGYRLNIPLPIEAKDVPRVDAVLYTHADDDHFGRLTAQTFAVRLQPKFLAPSPVGHVLKDMGVDERRIIAARDFESIQIGHVEVVVTPALHDWQGENPWQREDCCGYLVKTPDGAIWHPGDTRLIDELLEVRGVDVLFFDVAAVDAHLGPVGSARLAETSGAKVMIAYHYGTFDLPPGTFGGCDPEDSLPHVKGLAARFLQLDPGEPFRLPLEATA
jgi:L-ascorbate metabolism protein UlaG (beta-lactamase superfamily)